MVMFCDIWEPCTSTGKILQIVNWGLIVELVMMAQIHPWGNASRYRRLIKTRGMRKMMVVVLKNMLMEG